MLWRRSYDMPPPPIAAGQRVRPGAATRATPASSRRAAHRVPQGRRRADDALLGGRDPGRPARPARRCSSPPTATAARRWSSTSTGSATRTSPALNIPTGMPLVYELDDDFMPVTPGGAVPRPRGRRRGRRRRRQPGPLAAPPRGRRTLTAQTRRRGPPAPRGRARQVQLAAVLAGDQVDDAVRDRDRVVGEPLVVATDQGHVDGRLGAVRPVVVDAGSRRTGCGAARPSRRRPARGLSAASTSLAAMTEPALATIRSATWPICRIVRADVGGTARVGVAQPGDLGDVPGEVAHPLEVGAHPHDGDDDAQVGGDRLLAGQQVDGRGRRARSRMRVELARRPR